MSCLRSYKGGKEGVLTTFRFFSTTPLNGKKAKLKEFKLRNANIDVDVNLVMEDQSSNINNVLVNQNFGELDSIFKNYDKLIVRYITGYSGWKQHPFDLESMMIITSNCVNLKEVNFAKAQISESAVNYLVENLTPNLEKLSLLCQSQITDKHVWALVNRCNKLCTLVLRNTCTTDASVTDIVEKLESTLEELDIHRFCYGYHVKPDKLFGLRKLPKFKVLNFSSEYKIVPLAPQS